MLRMRRREQALYGSSDTGQSRVSMRLDAKTPPKVVEKGCLLPADPGARYPGPGARYPGPGARYLGYGVMEAFGSKKRDTKPGQLTRPCLAAPFEFVLRIVAREQAELDDIEPALRLFGLVGGLGARSRKGYGSLNLTKLEGDGIANWRPARTVEDYRSSLGPLLKGARTVAQEPEISAFSACARIDLMFEGMNQPLDVLDKYGSAMVRYRSWGRNGKILDGERSECRFREDHDWMKGKEIAPGFHPRRAVFGLPHNYGRGIEVTPQHHDRRASPLFFHVHEIGSRFAGIALLLRSRFLPEGEKILTRDKPVPANPDWSVLTEFIDENRKRGLWPDG